jgi:hypothetical protein
VKCVGGGKYRHWIDADRDGCSRNEVLLDEAVTAPTKVPTAP